MHAKKFALALISKTTKKYPLGQLCADPVLVYNFLGIYRGFMWFADVPDHHPDPLILQVIEAAMSQPRDLV